MEKSNHKYPNGIIPYDEVNNFVEPINATICFDYCTTLNFILENQNIIDYSNDLNILYKYLYNDMPVLKEITWDIEVFRKMYMPISYTPHLRTSYDFRLHPIDILNKIFERLGLSYRIPFMNLDLGMQKDYFKEYVLAYMNDLKLKSTSERYKKIADEIINNIDKFLSLYNIPIDMKKYGVPKDILFNLAVRSLEQYEESKEEKYLVIPDEYYKFVSHMKTSSYPHSIKIQPDGLRKTPTFWFDEFNEKFREIMINDFQDVDYQIDHKKHSITNSILLVGWEVIPPGKVDNELRKVNQNISAKTKVDYEWFQKMFQTKTNYYLNSPYKNLVLGRYGLDGYMGFSYPNEYLVLDKLYNRLTPEISKRSILTHSEAIYALPADRFTLTKYGKNKLQEEKANDSRIKKINHTINNSYLKRLDSVIYGPNVSTSTIEEELEKAQGKILIKR